MRILPAFLIIALLAGCRGEPVPRDYQSQPPAMTNPVDKPEEAPSAQTTDTTSSEPSYGAEGTANRPFEPTPTEGDKATATPPPTTTT